MAGRRLLCAVAAFGLASAAQQNVASLEVVPEVVAELDERQLQEAGSDSPPPLPPRSPPGAPGAAVFVEHSLVVTMVAQGNVAEFPPERVNGIRQVFANDARVPLSSVSVTILSGSVVIQTKVICDNQTAADTVSASLEIKLATTEASSTFLALVPGGPITVLSAPVVVTMEENKVVYPPPPPPSMPLESGLDGGMLAGLIIGSLLGVALFAYFVIVFCFGKGDLMSKPEGDGPILFTNVGPNQQENV